MELIIKAAAAALTASVAGLLIKKSNPELALLLGGAAAAVILISALNFSEGIRELYEAVRKIAGGNEKFILPVLKCLAVALITKLSSELCRDASQSAAASALELTGTICAFAVALPAILSILNTIGGFL